MRVYLLLLPTILSNIYLIFNNRFTFNNFQGILIFITSFSRCIFIFQNTSDNRVNTPLRISKSHLFMITYILMANCKLKKCLVNGPWLIKNTKTTSKKRNQCLTKNRRIVGKVKT